MVEAFEDSNVYAITLDFPNMKDISFSCLKGIYKMPLWFNYSIKFGLPITLLISFFSILRIFLKHKPHMIFSTGSEIAVPAFLLGKFLFGAKVVYIECFTRIKSLSLTGKIVYRFSDRFLVQWPELAAQYDKALYRGRLI